MKLWFSLEVPPSEEGWEAVTDYWAAVDKMIVSKLEDLAVSSDFAHTLVCDICQESQCFSCACDCHEMTQTALDFLSYINKYDLWPHKKPLVLLDSENALTYFIDKYGPYGDNQNV